LTYSHRHRHHLFAPINISKSSNGDSEQDRKAQSALTTAPKETKYQYKNATQLMKFS